MKSEKSNSEPSIQKEISRKYNIIFLQNPTWQCKADFSKLKLYGTNEKGLNRQNFDYHFDAIAGPLADKSNKEETQVSLGIGETPKEVKALTFKGEFMSNREFLLHKRDHEIGHVVAFFELYELLKEQNSINKRKPENIKDSLKLLEIATKVLRESNTPISNLHRLKNTDGIFFYAEKDLMYEDLAEMYAHRSNPERWKEFTSFIQSHEYNSIESSAARVLIDITDELFSRATNTN